MLQQRAKGHCERVARVVCLSSVAICVAFAPLCSDYSSLEHGRDGREGGERTIGRVYRFYYWSKDGRCSGAARNEAAGGSRRREGTRSREKKTQRFDTRLDAIVARSIRGSIDRALSSSLFLSLFLSHRPNNVEKATRTATLGRPRSH